MFKFLKLRSSLPYFLYRILVVMYEIKYNETKQELIDQFDNCLDVKIVNNSIIQPVPPGKTIAVDVFIEYGASGSYFIAVRAIGTLGAKVNGVNIAISDALNKLIILFFYRVKCLTLLRSSTKNRQLQK